MTPLAIGGILVTAAAAAAIAAVVASARAAAAVRALLDERLDGVDRGLERVERAAREEIGRSRAEASLESARLRDEVRATLKLTGDSTEQRLDRFGSRLERLMESNEQRLGELRAAVEAKLQAIREDNAGRLEAMRQTVDEKLQGTLDQRLGESFRQVSERLEAVQKGLGEMNTLAAHVGDLRKVLTNVKTRGTWGEVQLGSLLEQVLAPSQYLANAQPKPGSAERVEFAIRLPGRDERQGEVLLPIDAKFPVEDYLRLVEASERGDAAGVEESSRQLVQRVKACARDVHDKYLNPPRTTDFALLYLPTEGLYAEVARRVGLLEQLQRDWKVTVAGPTTLLALLNALQMGFSSLVIERRSSEVWQLLGAVKSEFGKFGAVFEKVGRKLEEAKGQLDEVGKRRTAIERRLKDVEELPPERAQQLLPVKLVTADPDDVPA
jgi:DNA recombination protein RmuC